MLDTLVPSEPPLVLVGRQDDVVQEGETLRLQLELLLDLGRVLQDHLQLRSQELGLLLLELHLSQRLHHSDLLRQRMLEGQLRMDQLEEARERLVLHVHLDLQMDLSLGGLARDEVLQDANRCDGVRTERRRALAVLSVEQGAYEGAPVGDHHLVVRRSRRQLVHTESKPLVHVGHCEGPDQPQLAHGHVRRELGDLLVQRERLHRECHQVSCLGIRLRQDKARDGAVQALHCSKPDLEAAALLLHAVGGKQWVHRIPLRAGEDGTRAIVVEKVDVDVSPQGDKLEGRLRLYGQDVAGLIAVDVEAVRDLRGGLHGNLLSREPLVVLLLLVQLLPQLLDL
mmetsp:Transcript_55199/g.124331  ORF Transcript_55199/g.124331 Transcript_55199/m.124331 type:complete len:340 (+) Transcript_55199:150-1169(+)